MVEVLCRTAKQTDADLIMFGGYEEHYAADGTCTGCTDIAPVLEGVYRGDPCPQLFPQLSAMSLVTRQLFRRRCIEEGSCRFTDYKIAEDALFFVSFTGSGPAVWWASRTGSTAIVCGMTARPPRATTRSA